jgi:hypothetical protein
MKTLTIIALTLIAFSILIRPDNTIARRPQIQTHAVAFCFPTRPHTTA